MDREYTTEVERERKLLRPILKDANRHSEFSGKCKLDGGNLVILVKIYNLTNLHSLPPPLSGFHVTSSNKDNIIGFFGELNPLSNFHPAPFNMKNQSFHSSEQFIQYTKTKFFEDENSSNNILACDTALEYKQLARDIRGYTRKSCLGHAKELCKPGILAKFEQNLLIKNLLLNTGNSTLVESSQDKDWGTGIPLHDDRCLMEDKWTSQGLLEQILEEIRTTIHHPQESTSPLEQPTVHESIGMEIGATPNG